jgi:hypothetical protein
VLEHEREVAGECDTVDVGDCCADEPAVRGERLERAALGQRLPVGGGAVIETAQDPISVVEDGRGRIAERGRFGAVLARQGYSFSAALAAAISRRFFGDSAPNTRPKPILITTMIPAKPAATAEAIMLPEPASRYARTFTAAPIPSS